MFRPHLALNRLLILVCLVLTAVTGGAAQELVKVTTVAASTTGHDVLKDPQALALDLQSGAVFIADRGHHRIVKVDPSGTVTIVAGSGLPGKTDGAGVAARFREPQGIAIDSARNVIYVADTGNHLIRRVTFDGIVTTYAGTGRPEDRDAFGTDAGFKEPVGLALDLAGNLYVADSGNDKIRMITASGNVTTFAGAGRPGYGDGPAVQTLFKGPRGVAVSPSGDVYVADTKNHVIRRVVNGIVSTFAGTTHGGSVDGTPNVAEFKEPSGIALDDSGDLWIADTGNHQIRRIDVNGMTVTVAGDGNPGFVDGSNLSGARFHEPMAVAVAGAVFISDSKNDALRMITPALTATDFNPRSGSPNGGDTIHIFGLGFVPGRTDVTFDGVPATSVVYVSSTELTVITPAHSLGDAAVRVTTPAGSVILASSYRYLVPPLIDAFSPGLGFPGTAVAISGRNFDFGNALVFFGGVAATVVSASDSEVIAIVPAGATTGRIVVTTEGGTATSAADFVILIYVRISIAPLTASLEINEATQLSATGVFQNGSSEPLTSGVVWTSSNSQIATVDQDGNVVAVAEGSATITATFASFSASATIEVRSPSPLPPDPATTATPIDPSVPTSFSSSIRFLYSGPNPVQFDVADGAIDEARPAVLRGRVLTRDGAALSGVRISVHGNDALGYTLSRADGRYDLVVNGGDLVMLDYSLDGFLPAQRQTGTTWNRFSPIEDVALVPLDPAVTQIEANAAVVQVARATEVHDEDGTRRATLVFPPQTRATMTLSDGSVQPLASLSVRATEYTVGPNGPKAMPASLPPQSGYTYCVELSADEAIAAGAKSVEFSQEVAFYVDNFLGFPVGEGVPVGYYDREKMVWMPIWNGRVVKILSITAGAVTMDTDGDGIADNDVYSTLEERQAMASLYTPGQTLWRIAVEHFTPFDLNWPLSPNNPSDALPPNQPPGHSDIQPDDPACQAGSVIQCESQALGESIPIAGTPFRLSYNSARVPGRTAAQKIELSLTSATLPPDLQAVELAIEVAGQEWTRTYAPSTNLKEQFEWDGKDAYGRTINGNVSASIVIRYRYPVVYRRVARDAASFSLYAPGAAPLRDGRTGGALVQTNTATLRLRDARGEGFGGWTLDAHHTLDAAGNALLFGNGGQRTSDSAVGVVTTIAGRGPNTTCSSADGALGTSVCLRGPRALAAAPDGSVYVADDRFVKRIAPDGKVYHVAGIGSGVEYSGDGGPAVLAAIGTPEALALGPDGSIYITHMRTTGIHTVILRRIAPNGIIETLAESPPLNKFVVAPDGAFWSGFKRWMPGRHGSVQTVSPLGGGPTVVDPAGVVYSVNNNKVYRLDPDGVARLFAELCTTGCLTGLGGALSRAPDGRLFASTMSVGGRFRIYEITPEGKVTIAVDAANGDGIAFPPSDNNFGGDGGPASNATFDNPRAIAIGANGSIYVADTFNRRVRKITGTIATTTGNERSMPSAAGDVVYIFDNDGRHLRTVDARLGTTLLSFAYDSEGRVQSVTDVEGRVTTITRAPDGRSAIIEAPTGQQTTLSIDANGYLSGVIDPALRSITLTHTADGLLTEFRDAGDQSHFFSYTDDGRLLADSNSGGASKTLTLAQTSGNLFSIAVRTMMGRTTTYLTERLADGDRKRTTTNAAGLQTLETRSESTSTVVTGPDGTKITHSPSPDPRFGMQAPLGTVTINTPAGLTMTATTTRSVILANPIDPLSLRSETTTTTINGKAFRTTFDAVARTVTDQSPLGRMLQRSFDAIGRTTSISTPGLSAVEYQYDEKGRIASIAQGSRSAAFTHDSRDRIETVTDTLSRTIRFEYDEADRMTRQVLPGGRDIRFTYDANGNVTSITPPGRPSHLFTFTSDGLTETYQPPGFRGAAGMHFEYDGDRQLRSVTKEDGSTIDVGYDTGGRLSTIETADAQYLYTYLPSGNLSTVSVQAQMLTYGYDGSLPTAVSWSGPVTGTVAYAYDNNFRTVSENGVSFGYDNDGLLIAAGALQLQRNASHGLLTGTTLGAVTDSYTYNQSGEITGYMATFNGAPVLSFGYTRDSLGRIAAIDAQGFEYGDAGRLVRVTNDGTPVAEYEYDANNNRAVHRYLGGSATATYDDQDRLLTYGDATYEYTASGDLRSRTVVGSTTSFHYDALGNLRNVQIPGRRIDYVIDGQNRRIGKKIDGVLVQGWLYADQLRIVAELNGTGTVISRFVYGSRTNVPDYMIKGGVTYRILSDHLGSPRLVVNAATGSVAQALTHDEFGRVITDTAPGFQPFGFAGGLYDRDTGLVRFGARDYDPHTGRWTTKDPILFRGLDTNLYAYVWSDPINLVDPAGLWGAGPIVGGEMKIGNGAIGAAGQLDVGYGTFWNSKTNCISGGSFSTSGGYAGGPTKDSNVHYPEPGPGNNPYYGVLGGGIGVGGGFFLTNADSVEQLSGYFNTFTLDLILVNFSLSWGGGIGQFSVTAGPAASTGGFSTYPTNTDKAVTTWNTGSGCGCK